MEKESDNGTLPTAQNEKEKSENLKKYNFYRKPSIKKKPPEVKQTLTSYKRMLKANPLLKYEMEGKNLSQINKQLLSSSSKLAGTDNTLGKPQTEKQSLQPNFNSGKPLVSNIQRSKSLKDPPKSSFRPQTKGVTSIISGNKPPQTKGVTSIISGNKPKTSASTNSINVSKQSSVDFNPSTSKFLCSTKLENASTVQRKVIKSSNNTRASSTTTKINSVNQDNSVSNSKNSSAAGRKDREKKSKPVRRSLSAQHFDSKKGIANEERKKCFSRVELTQSLDDVSSIKTGTLHNDISPIAEGSHESSIKFRTPSAYERRSIRCFTPRSTTSFRRSLYHPSTPLPSLHDLQKRLNDWLAKRGKNPSAFNHLKTFANQRSKQGAEPIDEENKENIEVDQELDKNSWEDLKIPVIDKKDEGNFKRDESLVLNEENAEHVARAALEDLHKLIQEGYPRAQCEGWLELIREKYRRLEEEPQYWECRAAIEQSRGNISNAVQCYKTAIVQGAEIQAVDESLDMLLQKFSLLNISTENVESEKSVRERARIVKDARTVFKSSIIQFAVQERKLKTNNEDNEKKLVAIPVRRSTRLSRSAYTSTPGVKIFSSLRELDTSDRETMDFKKNKALF